MTIDLLASIALGKALGIRIRNVVLSFAILNLVRRILASRR